MERPSLGPVEQMRRHLPSLPAACLTAVRKIRTDSGIPSPGRLSSGFSVEGRTPSSTVFLEAQYFL